MESLKGRGSIAQYGSTPAQSKGKVVPPPHGPLLGGVRGGKLEAREAQEAQRGEARQARLRAPLPEALRPLFCLRPQGIHGLETTTVS